MNSWLEDNRRFRAMTLSCWYLTGPTCVGKTRAALPLAKKLNAEIVSLDSMAVYQEMDVGTAKPPIDERDGVVHHMIDIVDPSEDYTLARYVREATDKIAEIQLENKNVLFVGGTPLYLKAMLRGIFEGPPADKDFREALLQKVHNKPPEVLHGLLEKVDPVSAKKLHPNDIRRIVRALEVFEITGTPISEFQKQFEVGTPAEICNVYVMQMSRDRLYDRIEKRVDRMMYDGLYDETKLLHSRILPVSKTARQALGYRELYDYIEGKCSLYQAVDNIKKNTRHFAKHQETWFRSLCECQFISADKPEFAGLEDELALIREKAGSDV